VDPNDKRKLDYEQVLETYRQFADIRFKLLAFVPALSGAAIALLTRANIERWEKVGVAGLGFFVTLGIVLYDQRNTQFYNGAITRAQYLEKRIELEKFGGDEHAGLFGSRKDHPTRRLLGLRIGHDLGLAFVYCPVLGAWAFVAVRAGWPARAWVALLAGLAVASVFFAQFEWNDGKPERLRRWWRRRRGRRTREAMLKRLNEDTFRAESKCRIDGQEWDEFLRATLTDEFVLRRSPSDVEDETREEMIRRIHDGKRGVERTILPSSVRVWATDKLSIAASIVTLEDETDTTKAFQNVKVFVESNGRWRCAYWQVTPRPVPADR
jgi:hypothetical protein